MSYWTCSIVTHNDTILISSGINRDMVASKNPLLLKIFRLAAKDVLFLLKSFISLLYFFSFSSISLSSLKVHELMLKNKSDKNLIKFIFAVFI